MVQSLTFDRAVGADGVLRKLDELHQPLAVARSLLLISLMVRRYPIRHTLPGPAVRKVAPNRVALLAVVGEQRWGVNT